MIPQPARCVIGVILTVLALTFPVATRATTVSPPTFDELVDGSELVFRGRVKAVESRWRGEDASRRIATFVTFEVTTFLKGAGPKTLTLEFMGGQVGRRRFTIAGMPQFAVDEEGVFFVERRDSVLCPIARLRHGRYRVVTSEGSEAKVLRDDGSSLRGLATVREPLRETAEPARAAQLAEAMTLREFEAGIARRAGAFQGAGGARK